MGATSQSNEVSNRLLILQIEDNRADAELARLELSNAGFEVSRDLVDTLEDVASRLAAKAYDVVLADYRLPGWVGPAALPIVRQHQPDVPFILVTGTLGDELAVECLKQGVTDVVLKDHLARLPLAVRRALEETSLREQRKRAEQARRASDKIVLEWKKRLELAEKASLPIGLWEWDVNSNELVWSDETYRQFGLARDTLPGIDYFYSRLHPEDRPNVEAAIRQVASGPSQTYEVQFRVVRPDGTSCWLDSRGVMVRDGSPRMIGIAIDITKLRRSEAEYRAIVDTAPYGVYRSSLAGRFVMANPALVTMLGYESESELLALEVARDVYCKPGRRSQVASRVIESGYIKDVEVDWKRKDGRTITVHMSVVPVHGGRGEIEGFQGFIQDVTERKTLAKQFWQAQKMEAIGRLAGGVAHDLNNVLMVVSSYADLILQRQVADEKVARYAEKIREAAMRAATVTRQLLAFSRQQVLEPEVLDLNTVVSDLSKILPKLLGENVAVVTGLEPVLRRVKADRGQMEQVILNLAVNARDAMPKGGRFEIQTRSVELDAAYAAEHSPMQPGAYVSLSVTDTGIGMDNETLAHIFEPFFTTKEKGSGTGLGLAMVYGVVKQSGGFIWVISRLGQGTTFDVYLPQVEEPVMRASKPEVAAATSEGSETILLVEDEEALRAATGEFLQSRGYTVLVAGDSVEAIGACKQHTGSIDAILTDLVMPGMDGVELAKTVSARYPGICVLYMSGYTDRFMEGLGPETVLLQKPFTLSALASKLRTVLERSQKIRT